MAQSSSVKVGGIVMLIMGIYLAIFALMLILRTESIVVPNFECFTEATWSDFLAEYHKVGGLLLIIGRFLGGIILTWSVFVILTVWRNYREGNKWSWYTLLVANILGWGTALVSHIAIGYLLSTAMVVVGIVVFIIGIALSAKAILSKKST